MRGRMGRMGMEMENKMGGWWELCLIGKGMKGG